MAGQLFGVTVEAADGKAPVWNADVRFFCIKQDGKPKAYFFFVSLDTCMLLCWCGTGVTLLTAIVLLPISNSQSMCRPNIDHYLSNHIHSW